MINSGKTMERAVCEAQGEEKKTTNPTGHGTPHNITAVSPQPRNARVVRAGHLALLGHTDGYLSPYVTIFASPQRQQMHVVKGCQDNHADRKSGES